MDIDKENNIMLINGPDQLIPAESYTSYAPNGAVKLREIPSLDDVKCISVPTLIKQTSKRCPNNLALRYKKNDSVESVTYAEYERNIYTVAKAFIRLGLEKHRGVCILGNNSVEWMYSGLAAICAGGFMAGIYTTNSPEACLHCISVAQANIVVVEDDHQLQKILKIRESASHLKCVIQYSGTPVKTQNVYSWDEVLSIGENESDAKLTEMSKGIAVNQCCTVVYTSGTTGFPKGVMLSHDNLIAFSRIAADHLKLQFGTDRYMSFLPLSHILAIVMDIFIPWYTGATVYISDKDVLKNTLIENMRNARPTFMIGVPRVWEKIQEFIEESEKNYSVLYKWFLSVARSIALSYYKNYKSGNGLIPYKVVRGVLKNVQKSVGLNEAHCCTGGAPAMQETKDFFYSNDIPLIEEYGLSESAGFAIISSMEEFSYGKLGTPPEGVKAKIITLGDMDSNSGEIALYGRIIFMGYLNNPEKTKEAFDEQFWFKTGDLGSVDNKGVFTLTGRLKELVITSGGENVPASLIEFNVKSELPVVSNAILVGDKRKYLTILLTLKSKVDPVSDIPLDELSAEAKEWCQSVGYPCDFISEILVNKPNPIYDNIEYGIKKANEKAISNAQKVQKFAILPRDISVAADELGPTLKLKRSVIHEKYKDIIDAMYST